MRIVYSPDYDLHNMESHVENKKRTDTIIGALKTLNLEIVEPRMASPDDILRVHTPGHVEYVK